MMQDGRSPWLSRWAASLLVTNAVLASSPPVAAGTARGHEALARSAIVGQYDPALAASVRTGLLSLLADKAFGGGQVRKLVVKADGVTCRAGDVDIKAFGCTLGFSARTVTLTGRQAAELYAILIAAGVPSDGAAGTLYESVKAMSCTLDLTELGGPGVGDGDGVACDDL